MDSNDDHQSVRRIAAKLLHKDERQGLREVGQIAAGIDARFRLRFTVVAGLVGASAILAIVGAIVWVVSDLAGQHNGYRPLWIIGPLIGVAAGALFYWRKFQYGIGPVRTPQAAIYANADKASVDALERLFTYLGSELAPKAYYRRSNGAVVYLDYRHFYGSLRGLLLSDDASVRAGCLPPGGFWFSRVIKIEADPDAILKAINAKPKAGGRPKIYDEAAILFELIEQDRLRAIEPDKYGSESQIMSLIHALCDASDEHDTDIRVPESTELRVFAKKVLDAVRKNRARQK